MVTAARYRECMRHLTIALLLGLAACGADPSATDLDSPMDDRICADAEIAYAECGHRFVGWRWVGCEPFYCAAVCAVQAYDLCGDLDDVEDCAVDCAGRMSTEAGI